MPNGNHTAQSNLGTSIFNSPAAGPWNNNTPGPFTNTRPVVTPRGLSTRVLLRARGIAADGFTDAMNVFGSAALGSAALTSTTADHDAWGAYWNSTDTTQARTLSGNTSPRSRSDASVHDTNPLQKFLHMPSSMAQRGPVGSKPPTTAAMDSSKSAFKYPPGFSNYADEGEGEQQLINPTFDHRFPALSMAAQRQAHETTPLNAVGSGPSRKSMSGIAESDLPGPTNGFNDFAYGIPTVPAIHSQRPSLAGASLSAHPNVGFDQDAGRQAQMAEAFGMMGFDNNNANGGMSGFQDALSFNNGGQNFQFNPVSQPWDNGHGHANGFSKDGFSNGTSLEKRGSIAGRNSPAGSTYRNGGSLNSPGSFTGTPQQNPDGWSRPTSRDPRLAAELARRGLADPFAQQPTSPFFPNTFIPQNYQQFASPYAAAYNDPRHNAHLAGYGIPTHYSLAAAGVPTRPARDQDPGKSFRSVLLHDFKHSPKSKRWELKVSSLRWQHGEEID